MFQPTQSISIFIPAITAAQSPDTFLKFIRHPEVKQVFILFTPEDRDWDIARERCTHIRINSLTSTQLVEKISNLCDSEYTLLLSSKLTINFGYRALERFLSAAKDSQSPMVYSDRYDKEGDTCVPHQLLDYQQGSLRNDFDFGSVWLLRTDLLRKFAQSQFCTGYRYAGLYAMRLFMSRQGCILHLNEYLYTEGSEHSASEHEQHFQYLDSSQREIQLEYERACNEHLQNIGAWLPAGRFCQLPPDECSYPVEASVIIPVRNRAATIGDAIQSAISQKATFPYNVIVVNNHSDDGTGEIIKRYCEKHPNIIHLQPSRKDLGIGGCWDVAIRDEHCGRYAIQLDSDDLYSHAQVLEEIVAAFRRRDAAMVVGAYRVVDFQLQTLPPGLIDHAEWTDTNGRNNLLRVNGLGAPRAFRTQVLRKVGVPNVSYGEDYALGLAISRQFRVERIFDELYLCRRWTGNSDAALSIEKNNQNNLFKDKLRTIEITARKQWLSDFTHDVI